MAATGDWRKGPSPEDVERGARYASVIGDASDAPGVILDAQGVVRWRFESRPRRSAYSPLNLLGKPEVLLLKPDGEEVLRVRRSGRFPTRFDLVKDGRTLGALQRRSLLRNKYSLAFESEPAWTFHMPLFTLRYGGSSSGGAKFWVLVGPSRRRWNLLLQADAASPALIAGLAFIHRERWCYA